MRQALNDSWLRRTGEKAAGSKASRLKTPFITGANVPSAAEGDGSEIGSLQSPRKEHSNARPDKSPEKIMAIVDFRKTNRGVCVRV